MGIEVLGSIRGLRVEECPLHSDAFDLHGVYAILRVSWLVSSVPVLGEGGLGQVVEKGGETLVLGAEHQVPDGQWMVGELCVGGGAS